MGLRSWILKPYLERLQALEDRLKQVKEVSQKVQLLEERLKILNLVSDNVKENRLWIRKLFKDTKDIRT